MRHQWDQALWRRLAILLSVVVLVMCRDSSQYLGALNPIEQKAMLLLFGALAVASTIAATIEDPP